MTRGAGSQTRNRGRRRAPSVASWLVSRFSGRYQRKGLVGDLAEEYQQGRSRAWYWRQVLQAIAAASLGHLRRQCWAWALRLLIISGLLIGGSFGAQWPLFLIALDPSLHLLLRRRRVPAQPKVASR